MRLSLFLLLLPSCALSVADDGDRCRETEQVMADFWATCPIGHYVPHAKCDGAIATEADPDACRAALVGWDCNAGRVPGACNIDTLHPPW